MKHLFEYIVCEFKLKGMKIISNQWKSFQVNATHCKSVQVYAAGS